MTKQAVRWKFKHPIRCGQQYTTKDYKSEHPTWSSQTVLFLLHENTFMIFIVILLCLCSSLAVALKYAC